EAVTTRDVNIALKICRSEFEVDREYGQHFTDILAALTNGGDPPALVTVLFMFKNLEEIGDALLNIGEALIFAVFGEKLKVHQYHALGEALDASGDQLVDTVHRFESIWGTRSGCRIGRVPSSRAPVEPENPGRFVIFKEGKTRKLAKERDSLERWNRLQPGLVPQVVGFHEHGENASLLLEFIPGRTLQTLLLEAPDQLPAAYSQLENVLTGVWRQTRRDEPTDAAFVSQLGARLDDVFRVHPAFARPGEHIGSLVAPSFTDLLQDIRRVTAGLVAPLSVMIHGDLNLDNIMFEPESGTLHFIDLHRSAQTDYAQDVSVLMVSHFRRPVFDPVIRDRLTAGIHTVLDMALRFAAEVGDRTIEARMALGLVRSFFTSTRFELDEDFARAMLLRAVYLLRKLIAHAPRPWELFRLPTAVFSYP
ncbi:MAG: phosphotransferase, partial [Planctomycetota bacterium]